MNRWFSNKISVVMKIAISGKGGVGKTTLCALLAKEGASQGKRVLAIDADPNPTLASALNFPDEVKPLLEFRELIEERLGSLEGFFRLNPKVDDIPERFSLEREGIKLLVMGPISRGGEGCACPQNTFLRSLLQHLVLERDELVLLDLEAGLEPLGRGTAQGVDALLVVVEPDTGSLLTARRIHKLAQHIGVKRVFAVANKVREPADTDHIKWQLETTLVGVLPYSEMLRRSGPLALEDPGIQREVKKILELSEKGR